MDAESVKRLVVAAGALGAEAVEFTVHALIEAMADDGVSAHDIFHALANAEELQAQDDEGKKWKVYGPLVSGDQYAVVIITLVNDRVRVITTHYPP